MHIEFWGAVNETTGSMHIFQIDGKRIMLDCGLFQGPRKLTRERNTNFPFNPAEIYSLILSHAHIDHCGNIPNLIKKGFEGVVFATTATQDLCGALLRDSAHIQEKDVEYVNKKHLKKGEELVEPLYTIEDVERALTHFKGFFYDRTFNILDNVVCNFLDAGHILGSSFIQLDIKRNDGNCRLVFTGDVGRKNLPILKDPEIPEDVDFLIIETTYGNRLHDPIGKAEEKLCSIINRVVQRRGKIIIPAFSVGRTQEIVFSLHNLWEAGRLPKIPVFVDSPLSVNATEIFRAHTECYDRETMTLLKEENDPLGFSNLTYVTSVEKSKEINSLTEPCIIISSSGMCEAGRILHHLKNNIEDPRNLILIVGFQSQNTLGRRLVEKETVVKIFGEEYNRKAEVEIINSYSAHADRNELLEFILEVSKKNHLKKIFLVHGEEKSITSFNELLHESVNGIEIIIPKRGEPYSLIP